MRGDGLQIPPGFRLADFQNSRFVRSGLHFSRNKVPSSRSSQNGGFGSSFWWFLKPFWSLLGSLGHPLGASGHLFCSLWALVGFLGHPLGPFGDPLALLGSLVASLLEEIRGLRSPRVSGRLLGLILELFLICLRAFSRF